MPGYTKAQLASKKTDPTHYRWCRRCRLYWHQRANHAHEEAPPPKPKLRPVRADADPKAKLLSDREKEFIDWLVDQELKRWLAETKP